MCANCMDWSVGVVSHKTLMSLALIARQSLSETENAPPAAMQAQQAGPWAGKKAARLTGGYPRVAPAVGMYRAWKKLAAPTVGIAFGHLPERTVGAILFRVWRRFDVLKRLGLRLALAHLLVAKPRQVIAGKIGAFRRAIARRRGIAAASATGREDRAGACPRNTQHAEAL